MADDLDRVKADSDEAVAAMALASDQLIDRLLLLGDRRAGELAARLLVTFEHVIDADHALTDAAIDVLQSVHDKELEILGSNRQDAVRRLLEQAAHQR